MRASWIWTAAAAAIVSCMCGIVWAQDAPTSGIAKPKMMAKDADPDWEVATVKPSEPNEGRDRMDVAGRHVIVQNETVQAMLLAGFSVQKSQIAGAPDWVKTVTWDVDGVPNVEGEPDIKQLQSMLRKLLEERFGLKVHHEQQQMSLFGLTVAKGGPKLTENLSDPKGPPLRDVRGGNGQLTNSFKNTSMPELALMLLFYADRPIVDKTGLNGRYDFKLQWTMNETDATAPDAPPGLFTAIQEQLGLKLEPMKGPADVLVIDRVERPGAN